MRKNCVQRVSEAAQKYVEQLPQIVRLYTQLALKAPTLCVKTAERTQFTRSLSAAFTQPFWPPQLLTQTAFTHNPHSLLL